MSRTPPRAGSPSPWGTVQYVYPYAEGVISVGTAGHGGIWLSDERLAQMPANEQSTDGWYEEDCEAVFPLRRFRHELCLQSEAEGEALDRYIAGMAQGSEDRFADVAMNR